MVEIDGRIRSQLGIGEGEDETDALDAVSDVEEVLDSADD